MFLETKTPFPAARPSALRTIGYSQLSKKEYALSGSEKKLALPVGMSFSKRNFLENIFEPLIDFNRVSASVMGKKYYLSATKEERAEFIEVFKISLLDTYAETLAQWGDAEIITDFSYDEKKNKIVSIKQNLLTTNNIYPIIYKLREYKNGTYKIVNIIINGINLGQTFHNQFQALAIEKNENISSIISEWKSDAFIDG